jgi:hypothetical protein
VAWSSAGLLGEPAEGPWYQRSLLSAAAPPMMVPAVSGRFLLGTSVPCSQLGWRPAGQGAYACYLLAIGCGAAGSICLQPLPCLWAASAMQCRRRLPASRDSLVHHVPAFLDHVTHSLLVDALPQFNREQICWSFPAVDGMRPL